MYKLLAILALIPHLEGGGVMLPGAVGCYLAGRTGWTNPYVTDGLVAMWDGEWNAGGGVHDPNATTWKDLIGTSDMSIKSDAPWSWTDNSFSSDNSTSYNVVAKTATGTPGYPYFGEICYNEFRRTNSYPFVFRAYGKWLLAVGDKTNIESEKTLLAGIGTGKHVVSIDWPNHQAYDNGSQIAVSSGNDSWFGREQLEIGYFGNKNWPWWGEIYNLRFYSRSLTADEIAANYEIDKARFNLP